LSPADDVSHKHDGRLPLPATLQRPATTFAAWWTEARWVWTVCLRLLPDSVATVIWNPGRMLTIRLKCYNLPVLTINISKYEEWSYKCSKCKATCLPPLSWGTTMLRSTRWMTRLSVWDTFTTRLFHGKVQENVDNTSRFMTFRIRQRTRQQKSLFFDSDLIYLAMMLCMGLFLSVCLSGWHQHRTTHWTRLRQGLF